MDELSLISVDAVKPYWPLNHSDVLMIDEEILRESDHN